ncbi:MAG TPA: glutathione ABC transporter substrate-binding protein GsiB [Burkholderiales bacterium]|nr:glutathione ABC transporter substrate-binding protein GsiB [Burkholderiales bacterium]
MKISSAIQLKRTLAVGMASLLIGLAPTVQAAKEVVVAVESTFTTMDPYDANDTLSQAVAKSFYEGLFGFDKDMKIRPVLALSHEVSKDGLTYTIRLRKGVKFHDGSDFNAQAVKANFDRVTNPENKLKRFSLFKQVDKTLVVDDHTVKILLKQPFSFFLNVLAHPAAVMISPTALKTHGKDIGFHPVGTGPFQLMEWKQTDYLKVGKFNGYWRNGYPKVDVLTWRPIVDNNTRGSVLQTGEADFAYPVPLEQASLLKAKAELDVIETPSIMHRFMSMNTQQKPFDNVKVRQAINYAINKEALAKVAFNGYAVPAPGVIPERIEYSVKLGPWPYDPVKAKELLKEAGYENGFETELWAGFNNTTSQKVIQFLQQQLAQVGIKAKLQALESGQRVERVESWQQPETAPVRLYYIGWSASTGEADWAIRPLVASESFPPKSYNTSYYRNSKVDADIAKALAVTDDKAKAALYKDIQQTVWNDAPIVFLVTEKLLYAQNKKLSGMYVMPDKSFDFGEISVR